MRDDYSPTSDFLCSVVNDEVPFGDDAFGEANLQRLIAHTRDVELVNRDWATMLLGQLQLDRPDVRNALLNAATDADHMVRAEAIFGLAQLDGALALPLLQKELRERADTLPLLEAAKLVADPSLVDLLRAFVSPSGDAFFDKLVVDALRACGAASS